MTGSGSEDDDQNTAQLQIPSTLRETLFFRGVFVILVFLNGIFTFDLRSDAILAYVSATNKGSF